MADREIIRENHTSTSSDNGSNLIIGIVVAVLIGLIIYFIATGRFNGVGEGAGNGGAIDVNLNTPNNGGSTNTTPTTSSPDTSTQ